MKCEVLLVNFKKIKTSSANEYLEKCIIIYNNYRDQDEISKVHEMFLIQLLNF